VGTPVGSLVNNCQLAWVPRWKPMLMQLKNVVSVSVVALGHLFIDYVLQMHNCAHFRARQAATSRAIIAGWEFATAL
jgi:hypothetical protein